MAAASPPEELEVKFFNVDLDIIRKKLQESGAILETPNRLMRRVVYGGEANSTMLCTYGRIRDEGDKITMSAKYSAIGDAIASQKEAVVTVNDFEQAMSLLHSFGLQETNYQENMRETWKMTDGTLVELEQWPDLPSYIEVEGSSVGAVQAAAKKLGMDWKKYTLVSTDKLYQQHYNFTEEQVKQKLADIRFNL